jgi:hypothetical protein
MLHPLRRTRQRGVTRIVAVRGRSMEPTLYDGDLMLVSVGTRPHAGRLAVVRLPGERPLSVKRLAFLTPDGWWVERDNPREGVDSWQLGAVPEADVVALVIARCWPLRRGARLRSDHGE